MHLAKLPTTPTPTQAKLKQVLTRKLPPAVLECGSPRRFGLDIVLASRSFFASYPPTENTQTVPEQKPSWPHAPRHQLSSKGTFFVTAATYNKAHYFRGGKRLGVLCRGLLKVASDFGWQLEAWAVFSNHYHFVGHSPEGAESAESLSPMIKSLHSTTASWIQGIESNPDLRVWHNYRESRLTFQKSYLARLNYVHQNAVKHGLVPVANQYPWCSAGWFERVASESVVKSIYRFKMDQIKVPDDFEPLGES